MNVSAHIFSKVSQLTVFAALVASGGAHASDTKINYTGTSTQLATKITFSDINLTKNIGAFQVAESSGSSFWAYCVDPLTNFVQGASYKTASLNDFVTGGGNSSYSRMFNGDFYVYINKAFPGTNDYKAQNTTTVLNKLTSLYAHAYADSLTNATKSAAFQYAIWEIEGDASYSSTAGGLKTATAGSFQTQVDAYLSALTTNNWASVDGMNLSAVTNYTYTTYVANTLGGSQTFLSVVPSAVPEPSSIALLSLGLAGVAFTRRRKAVK